MLQHTWRRNGFGFWRISISITANNIHVWTLNPPISQLLDPRSRTACEQEEALAFGDGIPWGVGFVRKVSRSIWNLHGQLSSPWLWSVAVYQPCLRAVTAPWWICWPTRCTAPEDKVLGMFPREWAVCSPALGSQQVVSTQLLIGAGRAGGLSVPERSCSAERQTLVLTPCCGLLSFQSITGDTADKEPVCQCRP